MTDLNLKQIPYGETDFSVIQRENFAYVDKTQFIEALEKAGTRFPFIVRPRRFGKSLFTQILQAYYDKVAEKDFEANFANTYIGKHKTALANQFYVLNFDFSGFGADKDVSEGFSSNVCAGLQDFFMRYPHPKQEEILSLSKESASRLLKEFFKAVLPDTKGKLFVIIDEYDQFTNEILSKDVEAFKVITSAKGFVKDFYTTLKSYGKDSKISRIFITGVTSISLDSMTSGFSIATNLTIDPRFVAMFGFTEEELRRLITELIDVKLYGKSVDEIVSRMKELYNGYRFSPKATVSLFNSSMCLYYLNHIRIWNEEPVQLIDPSVSSDLSKVHGILSLGDRKDVEGIVVRAIHKEPIEFSGPPDVLNLQKSSVLKKRNILSALFYMGYLTFAPSSPNLVVPNRTIAQQFFDEYFQYVRSLPLREETMEFDYAEVLSCLYKGDAKPLIEKVASVLESSFGKNASLHLRESDFQIALVMVTNLASGYDSLTEFEVGDKEKHRADLWLFSSNKKKPSYLFELKYLTKEKGTDAAVKKAFDNAKNQLSAEAEGLALKNYATVKRVVAVFVGTKLAAFSQEG